MNKKGIAEALKDIIHIIVLAAVVLMVKISLAAYITEMPDTKELENELLIYRIFHSNNGISYFDENTGRLAPGVIDIEKIGNVGELIGDSIQVKLRVESFDKKVSKEYYNSKELFEELKALAFAKNYEHKKRNYYVLINKDGKLLQGLLQIEWVFKK